MTLLIKCCSHTEVCHTFNLYQEVSQDHPRYQPVSQYQPVSRGITVSTCINQYCSINLDINQYHNNNQMTVSLPPSPGQACPPSQPGYQACPPQLLVLASGQPSTPLVLLLCQVLKLFLSYVPTHLTSSFGRWDIQNPSTCSPTSTMT